MSISPPLFSPPNLSAFAQPNFDAIITTKNWFLKRKKRIKENHIVKFDRLFLVEEKKRSAQVYGDYFSTSQIRKIDNVNKKI